MSNTRKGSRKKDSPNTIAELNDAFRQTLCGGQVVITAGVFAFGMEVVNALLLRVASHTDFRPDNDPYGEHDVGTIDFEGTRFFWSIGYYDRSLNYPSDDPRDPERTIRVLTLMRGDEY